mmetsp:Transcript_45522/g.82332  ORF Transcript_45522/g.82332 Transcript_45522/m.82332 type:complete len:216 (-) Transcript_45522:322-969(-)
MTSSDWLPRLHPRPLRPRPRPRCEELWSPGESTMSAPSGRRPRAELGVASSNCVSLLSSCTDQASSSSKASNLASRWVTCRRSLRHSARPSAPPSCAASRMSSNLADPADDVLRAESVSDFIASAAFCASRSRSTQSRLPVSEVWLRGVVEDHAVGSQFSVCSFLAPGFLERFCCRSSLSSSVGSPISSLSFSFAGLSSCVEQSSSSSVEGLLPR